ncbi:glycogen debranching N-terminal domain-containing protein [Streptomyces rochei]|uniref:glycogen debranching N-terminal domain-containing protein n=1 Tax=Streptomyces rochei TaxID=1928 RepID=UPI0036E3E313
MHQPIHAPRGVTDPAATGRGKGPRPSPAGPAAPVGGSGQGPGRGSVPPWARPGPPSIPSSARPVREPTVTGPTGDRVHLAARGGPPGRPHRPGDLPPTHRTLVGVALPGLVISTEHAQLNGLGLEGFYRAGRRLLSRCRLRVAGREPLPSSARTAGADRTCFVATLRTSSAPGPDPDVVIERTRHADGTERITLRSCASAPLRLPVEVALGTDLADLGAIAAGGAGPELPATVHDSGLRWSSAAGSVSVTATPPPAEALASAGLLRWEFVLPPGGSAGVELRVRADGAGPVRAVGRTAADPLASAYATGDDPVVPALLRTGVQDLRALLLRDPAHPADIHTAAGIPWRCGPVPAEALAAARMALPLGTRLAAGTLRVLARTQRLGPGPGAGMIPGPVRDAGPHLPPGCTGTEATLLFPVLLAEARRWGLGTPETQELLPVAERCLTWLRTTVGNGTYVPDPQPHGPIRCETQAHAHRAALLGAELLDDFDRPGGDWLRQWAQRLRTAFRRDFWIDDPAGGRPAAALTPDGGVVPHLGAAAAHLLDTGLAGGGTVAPGLLDPVRTGRLARLLGSPAMDSGWGLRSLAATEAGYTPFGHRAGAVHVRDTAIAVAGLAAAGHDKEAGALLRGVLDAAGTFAHRLPDMYAGEQRADAGAPLPHPAACRPAATAAAAGVLLLTTLAGIRPDTPAGTVTLRPVRSAPLGQLALTGLRVAGKPFSVRVGRLGLAMVEEAADGLQLGV